MTTTTKRFIEQETTLPAQYQLPHPYDLSDSPLEQQAGLEKRAVRIIRDLSSLASTARDRLDAAKEESRNIWMGKVDQMISTGQVPAIPGVIKEVVLSATVLAEKTAKYAEDGLQLIKIMVTPTGANTNVTTIVYIDPKVITLPEVKEKMLAQVKAIAEASVTNHQERYSLAKADIEKFHKHFVLRMKQVKPMADLFKEAKEI